MQHHSFHPQVYKPLMAGLFAGFIAALLALVYNIFFRESTGFTLTPVINVSSIIFAVVLILTAAGAVYAVFDRYIKRPVVPYIIVSLILTILSLRFSLTVHRTDDPVQNNEFHWELFGVVMICGLLATFLIPYLATKKNPII
jgi:drug/metabolite transporter (DMT)-like permease